MMLARDDLHSEIAKLRRENELLVEHVRQLKERLAEFSKAATVAIFPSSFRLTQTETKVLSCLYSSPSSFRTRAAIHFAMCSGGRKTQAKIIDIMIMKIRRKLPDARMIRTVWGEGYEITQEGRAFIDAAVAREAA